MTGIHHLPAGRTCYMKYIYKCMSGICMVYIWHILMYDESRWWLQTYIGCLSIYILYICYIDMIYIVYTCYFPWLIQEGSRRNKRITHTKSVEVASPDWQAVLIRRPLPPARNSCFSSIMSSPGAEVCPWWSIFVVQHNILISISKYFSQYIKIF